MDIASRGLNRFWTHGNNRNKNSGFFFRCRALRITKWFKQSLRIEPIQAFGARMLPGTTGRGEQFLDAQRGDPLTDVVAVDGVAIAGRVKFP